MVDYAHKWTDQKLAEMEKHLRSIYKDAADEASVICSDYMESFSNRYVEQYNAYMNGAYTKQQFEEWYAAQIGRGERWEAVRQNMAEAMTHSNEIAADYMNSQMPAVFAHNYNWSSYAIEIGTTRANLDGADMAISFTLVDENTVKRLATTTPDLLPKARVDVPKDIAWNQRKMQNALLQGILLGDSVDKIAARIALAAGHMNEVSAMRNARTMVTEAENRGRLENYREAEKMGLNIQKEWIATNDDRTRESHAELSGVRVAVKDLFPNGCICPGDHRGDPAEVYNCRCTMRSVFPGSASEQAHVTGKTVETFNDWLKRKIAEEVARKYLGIPRNWSTIENGDETALTKANPNYKKNVSPYAKKEELEYNKNCANSVVAYEMRCRDYDVVAKGYSSNKRLSRDPFLAWEEPEIQTALGYNDLVEGLILNGEGSRSQIVVDFPESIFAGKTNHTFVAEVKNGKIRFLDPQSGGIINSTEDYLSNATCIRFAKINDRAISDIGVTACEMVRL